MLAACAAPLPSVCTNRQCYVLGLTTDNAQGAGKTCQGHFGWQVDIGLPTPINEGLLQVDTPYKV
jgi:hypothetical protein